MPSLIQTHDLQKSYGKGEGAFQALKGINITIEQGQSIAIVGKSGSGKSTLMHLLALLDSPSSGSVIINGANATELDRAEVDSLRNREFGFIFQQFFLNAADSVLDNVILPLKIAGTARKERRQKGLAALEAVELADKATNKASALSGGQKQRAAIARALINQPKVIFADEPTGNLDTVTGERIEDLLFKLNQEQGITLIIVTHDHDLAARCQRRIYIKDGQIEREEK